MTATFSPLGSNPGQPVVSVIIPAFNRIDPLRDTLRSALLAAEPLSAEIILVDDGSEPPLSQLLADLPGHDRIIHLHQTNQGAIAARLHGLERARGAFVLFLDSDDLLHPDKLAVSVKALQREQADVVYDDLARATRSEAGWEFSPSEALPLVNHPAEFYLRVQPLPHSPVFRRSYLLKHLRPPLFPSRRDYDPAGDVWLYFNLAPHPAKIVKVDRALTAVGPHEQERYSHHWERIAVSALKIMEAFFSATADMPDAHGARQVAGECAFQSWRRLPRGFAADFNARMLKLWKTAPHGPVENLGGHFFQKLANMFGPQNAGRMLRARNQRYSRVQTVSRAELQELLRRDA